LTLLSIIIVNYRSPQLLLDCLASLYQHTKNISFEVIVVDNASGDESKERVTSLHPEVRWLQMSYNAGFARANNAGIRASQGDAVLLLNSDTVILNGAVDGAYTDLMSSPYAGCGVQLLNHDMTPQISGNFFMTGYLNNLLPLPYTGALLKNVAGIFGVRKPHVADADEIVKVDWINGAFLMVKREAIDKAGMLDEDFFLYAEEAEWCSRLRKVGQLVIFGRYRVLHLQGGSANVTFASDTSGYYNLYDKKGLQIMVSNFVRLRKQHGPAWYVAHLLTYSLTLLLLYGVAMVSYAFDSRQAARRLDLARQFATNMSALWRLTPTILRNNPHFYKVL
jgi:GT2 family glycosyltransferase